MKLSTLELLLEACETLLTGRLSLLDEAAADSNGKWGELVVEVDNALLILHKAIRREIEAIKKGKK